MLSILLLCTVAVSTTATATASPVENTICGRLPAVCNGKYAERTLEFVDDHSLTGTLPPELGLLNLTSINVFNTNVSGTIPMDSRGWPSSTSN